MTNILHITSGDMTGGNLVKAELPGEVLVWHDILHDGPRNPGWPTEETLHDRALFLEKITAGGMDKEHILGTLRNQYQKLEVAFYYNQIVLWFDVCLFDQSMLAHILTCLRHKSIISGVELLCVDSFPGIIPFHGLGQLRPDQLASLYGRQQSVTEEQFDFATRADRAFASQDLPALTGLSAMKDAPLPWIPAAAARWLKELPDPVNGLGYSRFTRLRYA